MTLLPAVPPPETQPLGDTTGSPERLQRALDEGWRGGQLHSGIGIGLRAFALEDEPAWTGLVPGEVIGAQHLARFVIDDGGKVIGAVLAGDEEPAGRNLPLTETQTGSP